MEAALHLSLVVQEVGTDEHQGGKLGAVGGVVELDAGILVEEAELTLVFLVELVGAFLAMEMAEELDELVLEMTDDGVLDKLLGLCRLQSDIRDMDAGDGNMHLVLEHREGDGQKDLALTLTDLLDDTIAARHRAADDGDTVALMDLIRGLTIEYLEVIAFDDGHETLYLAIPDLDRVAMLITVGVKAVAEDFVPWGIQDALDDILGLMDEDEMMQVAAQRTLIEHGIIVFIVVIGRGLCPALTKLQVLERDKEVIGRKGTAVILRGIEDDLSLATEDLANKVCVGVTQDAPSFLFVIYSFYIATFH